ncbi:MAG: hypothetical protein ACLQOZ_03665 [Acidimicrobiales bacterium]
MNRRRWTTWGAIGVAVVLVAAACWTPPASASSSSTSGSGLSLGETSVFTVPGVAVPGTPAKYDRVQVRRFGSPTATNVLVLVPGVLAGAADFDIVGPYLAAHVPNLQVWAEMRREGALEDNSMLLKLANGTATVTQAFDYYVGWLADSKISPHYQPLAASQYQFVDQWGLAVAMGDLHNVVELARDGGKRTVILGGHSMGGAEATIYSVWDFNGKGGYQDIAGIVGIDGDAGLPLGLFGGPATSAAQADAALTTLRSGSPWLDLLGLGLPWIVGPFAELAALAALKQPTAASIGQTFPLLPAELKPPVPTDNEAQLGYAFDASTSPAALSLIHVHSGHLATSGSPRGWVNDGPTPVQDIAFAFSQEPLGPVDWYFPERLTVDVEAASTLTQTPAAGVLGLRLDHEAEVDVPMYVIQTSLGGAGNLVANSAHSFQHASKIPSVTVVDETASYSHLDPLLATPSDNAFLKTVAPWIEKLPAYRR